MANGNWSLHADPITGLTSAQLTALAAAGELTPGARYIESDTGVERKASSAYGLATVDLTAQTGNPTVAVIGDSLAAFSFQRLTITAISRTANVLSVTATGHGAATGARVATYGITNDATMNVSWAEATRVDANTLTVPSVGPDGTGSGTTLRVAVLDNYSAEGMFASAMTRIGGRLDLVYAGVRGGAQVADIVASGYVTACIQSRPRVCVVILGINDVTSSSTAATIVDSLAANIYRPLIAAGIQVHAVSMLPLGASYGSFSTYNAKLMDVNTGLRALAATTNGLRFIPAYDAVVDPLNATPGAALTSGATGMLNNSDYLHTQDRGAYFGGGAIAAALVEDVPARSVLVASNGDNYDTSATNANLLSVGLMAGSGGSVNGGVTGTAPTGWTADQTSSTSAVASVQARSDGFGNDFQMVFTPSSSSSRAIMQSQSAKLNDGRLAGGQRYQMRMEVTATGVAASNCANITAYFATTVGGVAYTLGQINGYTGDTGVPSQDLTAQTWVSAPFWVPAGSQVGPQITITSRHSASGAALTLKVGRVSFVKL